MLQRIKKRSRSGCLNCKKKKKKCDEIKPICTAYLKSSKICQYRLRPPAHSMRPSKVAQPCIETGPNSREKIADIFSEILNVDPISEYDVPLDEESVDISNIFEHNMSPLSHYFPVMLPSSLSEIQLSYLEYFCKMVLPQSKDGGVSDVCVRMAMRDKGVLYSLVAWGCRAMKNQVLNYQIEDLEADEYVEEVQYSIKANSEMLTRDKFVANICSYMILVCMKISFGDINDWPDHFTQCFNMIGRMPGGFEYLKEECSVEGNVLAESFAYYDVLASQSNENGTFFSIEQYKDLFTAKVASNNLYRGCLRPIIFLIGETVSLLVEYNSLRASFDLPECDKYEVVSTIIERANALDRDIQFTKLDKSYLRQIKSEEEDLIEENLTLFELYQLSAQIYVRQVIKKLPPIVPEIEVLFFALKQDLDILIESKRLRSVLGFPMLISGVSAVTKEDRNDVKNMFSNLIQNWGYMSCYHKLWIVIQKIWQSNKNGTVCVDWFEITRALGWKLNLGS